MNKIIEYGDINKYDSDLVVLELDQLYEPNKANKLLYIDNIDDDKQIKILTNNGFYRFKPNKEINKEIITLSVEHTFNFDNLKKLYEKVIYYAIDRKYKSIVTTLLYFCSYGYKYFDESLKAFNEVFNEINNKVNSDLDITVLIYNTDSNFKEYLKKEYCCNDECSYLPKYAINLDNNFLFLKTDKIHDIINFFSTFDDREAFITSEYVSNPIDFLYEYARSKSSFLKDTLFPIVSRNQCKNIKNGYFSESKGKKFPKLSKRKVLEITIRLNLNKSDFIQLLLLSEYSLNPTNPIDLWFYDYYANNRYDKNRTFSDFVIDFNNDWDVIGFLFN